MSTTAGNTKAYADSSGSFKRRGPRFTDRIVANPSGEGEWPAEPGRYRLVVSLACPWAHRSVIVRRLMGLEDAISLAITDPLQDDRSWRFSLDEGGVDPVLGYTHLEQAYLARDPEDGTENGVSVPAIVDVASGALVTNDYPQITVDLGQEWRAHQRAGAPDLYPEHLRAEIDEVNEGVFHDVNNGVYKAGFATKQTRYEEAYAALFARLDALEERLESRRYLVGDHITEADVRLFTTLARFDAVYQGHFKCNRQKLAEFGALWAYARDLYQTPGFGDTVDLDHIKRHYYQVQTTINPTQIVPLGPLTAWDTPHHREELGGSPFGPEGTAPAPLEHPLRPLGPIDM
ncbi:glutathione S-transferase C-terminal domain-containing protein [Actinomycetospora corticicola]|uniref:Putative glutathione S-transferase n=1 Tax=Actinomycetospora corticicola TaxID=663602 RepID=A0A7Y9DV39_9PSEU|nr:putative glutathione S-transferase [Actinomycetospora corticicola]